MKIICDPGSCHLGKLSYMKELIAVSASCGADAVKFQLFKPVPFVIDSANIPLPYELFGELKEYGDTKGIEVFASVWDMEGIKGLWASGCKSIKFAYSMRASGLLDLMPGSFENVYISGDTMTKFPDFAKKLYCIPQYPVQYMIDFEGLFPRFDGFSDHTLGWQQTIKAAVRGAQIIEKHLRLENSACESVPDGKFALVPRDLEKMITVLREME